jgi:hypothetical protein
LRLKAEAPRQPANTPHEARQRYARFLQRSLACIAPDVWNVGPAVAGRPEGEWVLTLPNAGRPIQLRREDGSACLLVASQRFVIVPDPRNEGEYKTSTREYIYKIWDGSDASGQPVVEWHWHPSRGTLHPHTHARPPYAGPAFGEAFDKHHLPTARVAFEQVVRFLIEDLEVEHQVGDWAERLDEALTAHEYWRSWAIEPPTRPPVEEAKPERTRPKRTSRRRT